MQVSIHVHQQPGEDGEALAERIARILERKAGASARANYEDY